MINKKVTFFLISIILLSFLSSCKREPPGTLKWSFTTGNEARSSPAIGSDGTIMVLYM